MSEKITRKTTTDGQNIPCIKLTYCDECGHLIRRRVCEGFSNLRKINTKHRVEWYQVAYYDDIKSVKETDICPKCMRKVFDKYLTRSRGENSQYIIFKHCWDYNHELLEDKNES